MKLYKWRMFLFMVLFSSAFVAVTMADPDLSQINVYPNPVRAYNGDSTVTFDRLTTQVKIVVLDVNAHVVRKIDLDNSGSKYVWDLTNDAGSRVASGIYTYLVGNNSGEKRRGKIAVLR